MNGRTSLTRVIGRALLRNPRRGFAWMAGGGLGLAIFGNMLLLQPEAHRSPLFVGNPRINATPMASEVPLPPTRPAAFETDSAASPRSELLLDIQTELARRGYLLGEPDGIVTGKTSKAIRDFQAAAGLQVTGEASDALLAAILTSKVRPKDQIANLLRATPDRLERPATVAAVQRALTKLGYGVLKDDGQFGPGTRAALDRFEKDRKLPSRVDNPTRVLRELSQASGVAIE